MGRLRVVYLDGNPCFTADDEENRVKFLAKYMTFYDPTNMTLTHLNGKVISVQEKVVFENWIYGNVLLVPGVQKNEES